MPKAKLIELYAHGLGIIDDARIEFGDGFNVITGETGAGKTLLLGALDLCLGGEGSSTRHAILNEMRAAAVFLTREGRELALTRESSSSGRLRSAIDGATTSAEALRIEADKLIVIHGQHDSLSLKNRSDVLKIIDVSGGVSTEELDNVRTQLHELQKIRDQFGGNSENREREIDFLQFQIGDIEAAKVKSASELHDVLSELTRLSDLRESQSTLVSLVDELDGESDGALLNRLAHVVSRIPAGSTYDVVREIMTSALVQAREGVSELNGLTDPDLSDSATIDELEKRATQLQSLARKYGGSLESALSTLDDLAEKLSVMTEGAIRLSTVDEEIRALQEQEVLLARTARRDRERAAVQLTQAVRAQLPRVALANALLRFEVDGDDGSEVQILFAPNPGLPEGPLQALASGGELSRVLLAISLETAQEDVVAVFDEVDAGVGGQVAQQIGDCLREVGGRQQVLAVTHLASVAAKANHHFVIEKSVSKGSTTTTLRPVMGEERIDEIARMLAGDEMTGESRALASRLLELGR